MPTSEQAKKIASHKFGTRKLAKDGPWVSFNAHMKNSTQFRSSVIGSQPVQLYLGQMDAAIKAAFQGIFVPDEAHKIQLTATKYFIPRSVWYGYIPFPTGSLSPEQRTQFTTNEAKFADAAGHLRSAIAKHIKLVGIFNDVANIPAEPNPGGVVTGDNDDHYPYGETQTGAGQPG